MQHANSALLDLGMTLLGLATVDGRPDHDRAHQIVEAAGPSGRQPSVPGRRPPPPPASENHSAMRNEPLAATV
ncbi:MAG: hypothetical protein ACJ72W_28155 [Actinoallomurus sp.]